MTENEARAAICDVGRDLWERGLVGGNEGNITVRLDKDRILATPSGAIKGRLTPEQIAMCSVTGEPLCSNKMSSEIALHLRIYKDRPEVQAVVHAHPTVATGYALAGKTIDANYLPEADIVLGRVALVPFAIPGTASMGDAIAPFLHRHDSFLLQSHGAVTVGKDITDAYLKMETLERVARVFLIAGLVGGARPLPPEGVRWLAEF
jgi:L-fuculose-phosphate aldolase